MVMLILPSALVFRSSNFSDEEELGVLLSRAGIKETNEQSLDDADSNNMGEIARQIEGVGFCLIVLTSFEEESKDSQDFRKFPIDSIRGSLFSDAGLIFLVKEDEIKKRLEQMGLAVFSYNEEQYEEGLNKYIQQRMKESSEEHGTNKVQDSLFLRILWIMEAYARNDAYVSAYELFEEVREKISEENVDNYRVLQDQLASLYWTEVKGQEDTVMDLYERIRNIYAQIVNHMEDPDEDADMCRYYANLAYVCKLQRKYSQAKLNYTEALNYAQKTLNSGSESKDLVSLLQYNLAEVYRILGEYESANKQYQQIRKGLSLTEITDLDILYGIAFTQLEQGQYESAVDNLKKIISEKRKKHPEEEAPRLITCIEALGDAYYELKKYDKAQEKYEESRRMRENYSSTTELLYTMYCLLLIYSNDQTKRNEMLEITAQIQSMFEEKRTEYLEKHKRQEFNRLDTIDNIIHVGILNMELLNNLSLLIQPYRTESEMNKIRSLLNEQVIENNGEIATVYSRDISFQIVIQECLAQSYKIQEKFDLAVQVYHGRMYGLLETSEVASGDITPERVAVDVRYYENLAEIYRAQGKLVEIEHLFKTMLDREAARDEHSDTATNVHLQLITHYIRDGKYKEASEEWKNVERMKEATGESVYESSELLFYFYNLRFHERRYREVREWYERYVDISHDENPNFIELRSMMARTYQFLQEYEKAKRLLDLNLEVIEVLKERAYPGRAVSDRMWYEKSIEIEQSHVELYMEQKKWAMAERKCWEVLGRIKMPKNEAMWLPVENMYLNRVWYALAEIYSAQGRHKDAESLYRLALKSSGEIQGKRHPDVIRRHRRLSMLYLNSGEFKEAEFILTDVLKQAEEVFGKNHETTLRVKYDLATIYQYQKRSEARGLFEEVVNLSEDIFGDNYPNTLLFVNGLANFHVEQGDKEQASALFNRVLNWQDELGEMHPVIRVAREGINRIERPQIESEVWHPSKQQLLVNSVTNQLLLFYEEMQSSKHIAKVLQKFLNESHQYKGENHEKRLRLATIYHDEERYKKITQLYDKDIISKDVNAFRGERDKSIRFLRQLSDSYYKQKSENIHLTEVKALENGMNDVELLFGSTHFREIREVRECINNIYSSRRNNVEFALKQNNKSIRTQLVVENFLDIKKFDAKITPLTCLFGDNHAGKTVVMKILYACQTWAYKKWEDMRDGEKYSKDMFLRDLYDKEMNESKAKEKIFDRRLAEKIERCNQSSCISEEIDIRDGGEFFEKELNNMIKYQIQSITGYIDKEKSVRQVWEDIILKKHKNALRISGENHFFRSTVSYDRDERELKVELDWEKIKQVTLKIMRNTIQLRIDVQHREELITQFYYVFRQEEIAMGEISIAPKLPIYSHSSTVFRVKEMTVESIKICILNILFYCTPFVFFEGSASLFPAHRTGSSIFLPSITSSATWGMPSEKMPTHLSQEDVEVMTETSLMSGEGKENWRMEYPDLRRADRLSYKKLMVYDRWLLGKDYSFIYPTWSFLPEENPLDDERKQDLIDVNDIDKLGIDLYATFSEIEKEKAAVIRESGSAIQMRFYKEVRNGVVDIKTPREVATSSLSLSLLNMYITYLMNRFSEVEEQKEGKGHLERSQEEEVINIMKYQGLSQVIFYDEPGNSLHPRRIVKVVGFLFEVYRRLRDAGIPWSLFCITHSPRVLRHLLYGVIKTFDGDIEKIKDHFSPIEFSLDPENDGLYVGVQLRIDEDVEYETYPFSDVNTEEYILREEVEAIIRRRENSVDE